jgi:hypothetical protein
LRLDWTSAQPAYQPCKLQQCLVDVILPLDQHAMTQRLLFGLQDLSAYLQPRSTHNRQSCTAIFVSRIDFDSAVSDFR